jgi:hypothetical protein
LSKVVRMADLVVPLIVQYMTHLRPGIVHRSAPRNRSPPLATISPATANNTMQVGPVQI